MMPESVRQLIASEPAQSVIAQALLRLWMAEHLVRDLVQLCGEVIASLRAGDIDRAEELCVAVGLVLEHALSLPHVERDTAKRAGRLHEALAFAGLLVKECDALIRTAPKPYAWGARGGDA